jgi:NADH-quinone oxidoreductase subunit L
MENLLWLIPLFPFAGFLITGLGFKSLPEKVSGWLASGMVFISFALSSVLFSGILTGRDEYFVSIQNWLAAGDLNISVELLGDRLSVFMMLIITGIGLLIHIYSIGYMHGDKGFSRFFSFINLFIFFMLLLVLGGNYLIMFIGWEGVGLCSYLLIGFWNRNEEYNNAARKAFVMNRIGDLGFLLGMFLIYVTFGSLSFHTVFHKALLLSAGTPVLTTITLLLFTGATGKSAQIPLLTWLPDAMAGPTPVSALIHAATMVTAGIYMIARSNVLFALAPVTMNVIAAIAIATALLTAIIALYQTDIKKVLAYSTISQLGLMFLGLSMGSFAGAMFHMLTHAFFKALLFLAAGSIIHSLSGEQDIRNMGGLKNNIRLTYMVFMTAVLAISGIPPFSGFFSKDEILAAALAKSPLFWIFGLLVSVMTAAYSFRLAWLIFAGSYRGEKTKTEVIHESPRIMVIPMVILALFSAAGALPFMLDFPQGNSVATFLEPVFRDGQNILHSSHASAPADWILPTMVTLLLIILSIYVTYTIFVRKKHLPPAGSEPRNAAVRLVHGKFYIDELYNGAFVRPLYKFSSFLHDIIDSKILDNIVESTGKFVMYAGSKIRLMQTGNVGFYLFAMVICIIVILMLNMFR